MKNARWFNTLKLKKKKKTVDAHHNYIMKEIDDEHKRLNKYKKEINSLQRQLDRINGQNPAQCSEEDMLSRYRIRSKIKDINVKIKRIENNDLECDYISNTLQFFMQNDVTDVDSNLGQDKEKEWKMMPHNERLTTMETVPMDRFVKTDNCSTRADRLNDYMNKVYISHERTHCSFIELDVDKCDQCDGTMITDRTCGIRSCKTCGHAVHYFVESERPSYVDPPQDNSFYSYKRVNHFNEALCQIQAKESTNIPEEVMKIISSEIKKMKVKDIKSIHIKQMKQILKKLKFNKYCEHAPHIIAKLNGMKPPKISPEIENELRSMFLQIQSPFAKVCPKTRKNFLSYSYVLYKMLELKELDEYLVYFPLLKSQEKLYAQDMIWKGICKILRWQFIPSV